MTTPENHPRLESLAAFVDGRLAGAERAQVIEHLASCEDCLEVVAETGAVQEELEEDEASQLGGAFEDNVVLHPSAWKRWAPAAASLAAALVLAVGAWRGWLLGPDLSVDTLASPLADSAVGLDDEAWRGHGWPNMRGAESQTPDRPPPVRTLTPFEVRKTTFRAGVYAVDLQVALRVDKRVRAAALADKLLQKIKTLPYIGGLPSEYETAVLEPLRSDQPLAAIAERAAAFEELLLPLIEDLYYEFGKWAEAGRLAALAGDRDALQSRSLRGALEDFREAGLDEDVTAQLEEIRERLRGDLDEEELERLAADFKSIIGGDGVRLYWEPAPPTDPADD